MHIIDFDIEEEESERLTQELILANASFDIKEVLSDRTSWRCCAVEVFTRVGTVNCAFIYDLDINLHHAAITDLMLNRIYPTYKGKVDQEIYEREKNNNIFILVTDESIVNPCVTSDTTLTYSQFKSLSKFLSDVKCSDYCTKADPKTGKVRLDKILWGNRIYSIDQIDDLLNSLRKKIYDKRPVNQYKFNYDFSKCKTEEDFKNQAREYAQKHFESNNLLYGTSEATR